MNGSSGLARGCACLVLSFCACGAEPLAIDHDCAELRSGGLVITELHVNPAGTDGDGEYIEIFNPGEAPIALLGLTLVASRSDGEGAKAHRLVEGSVGARSYFVLGNAGADQRREHVDYSYGSALGNLRNSDGSVSLWCDDELVDRVMYSRTTDGRALQLDGELAPSHATNDDPDAWCVTPEGAGALGEGNFGTPGGRNTPCNASPADGTCLDGDSKRLVVKPQHGEVRITEWMANPVGPDTSNEWVEVYFGANADLGSLELGPSVDELRRVVDDDLCFPVDAGTWVVFGASPAAAPRVDAELTFSLGNSGARSIVAGVGGTILDLAQYDDTVEGIAWQADDQGNRCLAELAPEYAGGNFGTPGERNPRCPTELLPGTCLAAGAPRPIVSATAGQARITEWMADPAAVDNRSGEWIELSIDAAVDLNGLTLTDLADNKTTIESESCLSVPAGTRVVLARSVDESINGGIEDATAELLLSLNNRDEAITLSVGEEILDSISYVRSERGVATQIDDAGVYCPASMPYGDGDLGTPGQPNPACG